MIVIPDAVRGDRWMVAIRYQAQNINGSERWTANLTCSDTK